MPSHEIIDEDVIKILIASDIHLGYAEKDPIKGNDSFCTFEEILQIALKNQVDFMLLGGDLFHDNKPSRPCIHSCVCLLRQYCFGSNGSSASNGVTNTNPPCASLKYLSDPSMDFANGHFGNAFNSNSTVNYLDTDINITLPIFTIHGNHDDPTGRGNLSSIDLLSAFGLINYFGKNSSGNLETIKISPVLLQKGNTKLALYGLGSLRDERLHRLFANKNVTMLRPKEETDTWFNLMVIHQNRIKHGPTNYIPEHFLEDFLDLVLWGHEHECLIDPEWNAEKSFFVTQPGSSVATSLSTGEAVPKHVGLLQIKKKSFKLTKIPLRTVRPFCIRDINLMEDAQAIARLPVSSKGYQKKVQEYLHDKVCELIEKDVPPLLTGHPKQPTKPLIRLRIEYSENLTFLNPVRFGQKFVDTVANPKDIIHFYKKKSANEGRKEDNEALKSFIQKTVRPTSDITGVEDLITTFLQNAENIHQLAILTERGLGNAIREYIDKQEYDAVSELVKHQLGKVQGDLVTKGISELVLDREIEKFKEERILKYATQEQIQILTGKNDGRVVNGSNDMRPNIDDDNLITSSGAILYNENGIVAANSQQNPYSLLHSDRDDILKDYDNPFQEKNAFNNKNTNDRLQMETSDVEELENLNPKGSSKSANISKPKSTRGRGRGRGSSNLRQKSLKDMMDYGAKSANTDKLSTMSHSDSDNSDHILSAQDNFTTHKNNQINQKTPTNSTFSSLLLEQDSNSVATSKRQTSSHSIVYDSESSQSDDVNEVVLTRTKSRAGLKDGKLINKRTSKSAISQINFTSHGQVRTSPRKRTAR